MLHGHLDFIHPLLYLNEMEENNWPLCNSLIKTAFDRSYTYNAFWQVLDRLPPRPPPPLPPSLEKTTEFQLECDIRLTMAQISRSLL